ncbi:uncharacterized protein LOC144220120 [Crocuta crocuta]
MDGILGVVLPTRPHQAFGDSFMHCFCCCTLSSSWFSRSSMSSQFYRKGISSSTQPPKHSAIFDCHIPFGLFLHLSPAATCRRGALQGPAWPCGPHSLDSAAPLSSNQWPSRGCTRLDHTLMMVPVWSAPLPDTCRRSCCPSYHTSGLFSSATNSTGPLDTCDSSGFFSPWLREQGHLSLQGGAFRVGAGFPRSDSWLDKGWIQCEHQVSGLPGCLRFRLFLHLPYPLGPGTGAGGQSHSVRPAPARAKRMAGAGGRHVGANPCCVTEAWTARAPAVGISYPLMSSHMAQAVCPVLYGPLSTDNKSS